MSEVDNQRGLVAAAIILACCAILALFGCSQLPVAPNTDSSVNKFADDPFGDPAESDTVLVATASTSLFVSPDCDSLQVLLLKLQNKQIRLRIPVGALADTATISVIGTKYEIGKTELFIYECGPSGLQFQIPIDIQQPIPLELNGTEVTFLYYDETYNDGDGLGWEEIARSTATGAVVRFDIHHFSKYGISYAPDPVTNEEGNGNHHDQ